jgi:GST-like protein
MKTLADFPITARWPARHPERLQLYSLATPNGQKVSIALEELGLPYEAHFVDLFANEQKSDAFVSLNPNGRIPAIIDPDGPGGEPLGLFESGAILQYLAEKTGKLIPADPAGRWQTIQWVHFQMGGVGPMFGQMGYFVKYAGAAIEDPRPRERYIAESRRLLGVLDGHLAGKTWMMGELFTIADVALLGWVRGIDVHYQASDLVGLRELQHVQAWLKQALERPAVQRGLEVPTKPA